MTRSRSEIDDQYTWDPSTIYETTDAFDDAYERATATVASIRETLADPPTDSAAVGGLLAEFERLVAARTRLICYAEVRRTIDLADERAVELRDRVRSLESDVDALTTELRRYVRSHASQLDGAVADDTVLEPFERFLENAAAAPDADADLEPFLATFGDVLDGHDRTLTAVCDEDFEPPTVEGPDGEPVAVRWYGRGQLLKDPDRDFRRRVYEAFYDALDRRANAIATAWIEKLRTHARLAGARGYESIRDRALSKPSYPETGLHCSFPVAVHDELVASVTASLEPFHRLQRHRRDHLDVEPLRPWDLSVPITDAPEPTIPYDEACEHVVAAVEPLGTNYQSRLETLLGERRVDVYPAAEKREVVYCLSASGRGAYLSLCYDGSIRSLFHFAHELGHAMETELRGDERRPLYETTPRPVEEVPSMVHEFLLADHLLAVGSDALCEHVLNRRVDAVSGNLYGAARSARFTHEAARLADRGEPLTRTRLDEINEALHREFLPVVEPDDRIPGTWLARPHAREPYHHYQYVLGVAGAVSVLEARRDGSLTVDDYRRFLTVGGTRTSIEQFDDLGVDVTRPAPYERAAEWVTRDVDRLASA